MVMTPEELGNYTYGYIGAAAGFLLPTLFAGSWVAAGMPIIGSALSNEFADWSSIRLGFFTYLNRRQ